MYMSCLTQCHRSTVVKVLVNFCQQAEAGPTYVPDLGFFNLWWNAKLTELARCIRESIFARAIGAHPPFPSFHSTVLLCELGHIIHLSFIPVTHLPNKKWYMSTSSMGCI